MTRTPSISRVLFLCALAIGYLLFKKTKKVWHFGKQKIGKTGACALMLET